MGLPYWGSPLSDVAAPSCRQGWLLLQMGIANRDIKLENILLVNERNKPVLKLCDFGYSKDEYLESCCKTMCGESQRRAALAWLSCCRTCVLGIGLLPEGYWRWIRCCKIMCSGCGGSRPGSALCQVLCHMDLLVELEPGCRE